MGFVLQLRDVPHDSPLWGAMARSPGARSLVPREVHAIPYLDLHEYCSDACSRLASSMSLAKSLERHRRWLENRGRLRIELLRDLPEVMTAFETLVRLLHDRWSGCEAESALDNGARHRFHRRTIPLLLEEGLLRMVRVSVDLRTVAVYYGLAVDRWWGYYLIGYDRPWARRIHLGRLTLAFAIDLAIQAGASEFDFLKGSEPVKYLWPVRERITMDADVYASQSGAQLARATVAARDVGVALANSVLSLNPRE
jgi:CelD/BcsL family acetyltransferase involved in cellulose biosynthesis